MKNTYSNNVHFNSGTEVNLWGELVPLFRQCMAIHLNALSEKLVPALSE